MSKKAREEELRKKLLDAPVYEVVAVQQGPPVRTLADLPRGEWFVVGKSGRREDWDESIRPLMQQLASDVRRVACGVCGKPQSGDGGLPAITLEGEGAHLSMKGVCRDCAASLSAEELRARLAD